MGDMKVKNERDILLDIKKAYSQRAELKNIIRNRMATVVAERYNLLMENLMTFFKI
jgi:colanic acid/amylovoran biosynthesis protein